MGLLFCGLFNDAFSNSQYIPSNGGGLDEWCVAKGVEGSDASFVCDIILMIAWKG
jgi:hypothetical protein